MNKASLAIAAILVVSPAFSQDTLPDPTRPPEGLQQAAGAAPTTAEALVLQSVLLNAGRAPAAVINGQLVSLGGQVGDQRLAAVTEHSVQLKGPQGAITLRLMPDVHKQARTHRTEPTK